MRTSVRPPNLDYRGLKPRHGFLLPLLEDRPLIAAIGEQFRQKQIAPEQHLEHQQGKRTVKLAITRI